MTNEEICVWLKAEAEPKFQRFTSGLIPGTDPIIGVRIPKLRTLAKKIAKEDWRGYLEHAACDTYEEIMLQGLVLGYAKGEIDELLEYVRAFIPKIHDWSINDCFCATFKIAQKHREKVWNFLMPYAKSDQEFEQRVVAVAYAKYPKETHAFLLENHLDDETYNKAIQKMIESYRISAEDKEILRGMKRKLQK